MSSYRPERVAEQIHKEMARLLLDGIKDPRVTAINITGVSISRDLRLARIFYTVRDEQANRRAAESGLKRAAAFIRREISQAVRLRFVPELRFEYDTSISHGQKIDELLRQVQDDSEDDPADRATD